MDFSNVIFLTKFKFSERVLTPSDQQIQEQFGYAAVLTEDTRQIPSMENNAYIFDDPRNFLEFQRGTSYNTLPNRKVKQMLTDIPERSVTPDITRGLSRGYNYDREDFKTQLRQYPTLSGSMAPLKLGIPVQMPNLHREVPLNPPPQHKIHAKLNDDSFKVSPIDPRNQGGFQSSTPQAKDLRSSINLENLLLSPKKSTMSNEELYSVIHKSKKKLNIQDEDIDRGSPVLCGNLSPANSENSLPKQAKPESGYLGEKSRSRQSWSPKSGEYVDFGENVDRLSPESRSRQSWACNERKGNPQISRLDFKKLLLQHSKSSFTVPNKKISAVEQLKISKQQPQPPKPTHDDLGILELSRSPRSIGNRKMINNNNVPGSPRSTPEKQRSVPKLLSPRSQWRFASPRSDVLSSTIEECKEEESPNNSTERKSRSVSKESKSEYGTLEDVKAHSAKANGSLSERLQVQRAQFFGSGINCNNYGLSSVRGNQNERPTLPTLETAF